jgi:hypothetical protein
MINAELNYNEYEVKKNLQEKLKLESPIKFGNLPNKKDTQSGLENVTEKVMDSLTDIVYTNPSSDNSFLKGLWV